MRSLASVPELFSETESFDERTVTFNIDLLQIGEQSPSVTDHDKQAASGVMVLLMGCKTFVQLVDTLGEQSDLNFRRTGVALFKTVGLDDFLFSFFRHFLYLLVY